MQKCESITATIGVVGPFFVTVAMQQTIHIDMSDSGNIYPLQKKDLLIYILPFTTWTFTMLSAIALLQYFPYTIKVERYDGIVKFGGICAEIVAVLAERLNFT